MRRQEYAVFAGSKWARFNNKQVALKVAKVNKGEVRAMPYNRETWDSPTFYICSERIADFREVKQ